MKDRKSESDPFALISAFLNTEEDKADAENNTDTNPQTPWRQDNRYNEQVFHLFYGPCVGSC